MYFLDSFLNKWDQQNHDYGINHKNQINDT